MINDIFGVYIDFGLGFHQYEVYASDFVKTEIMHKELKGADNSCSFALVPSPDLATKLRGIGKSGAMVSITKNSAQYFFGYIRKTFSLKRTQRINAIKVEVVSPSFHLKRNIRTNILWQGYAVSNPDDVAHSILHQLLLGAGISAERIITPYISTIIPAFVISEGESTWYDTIEELVFEYGYILDFDETGNTVFRNMRPVTTSTTLQFSSGKSGNIIGSIENEIKEEEIDLVEVKWSEQVAEHGDIVFIDSTGKSTAHAAEIEVLPNRYYKCPEGESEVFCEYAITDKEVVCATDCTLDWEGQSDLVLHSFTTYPKKALLSIENTSGLYSRFIYKMRILGTAIIKKSANVSKVANSTTSDNSTKSIEAAHIHAKDPADALANTLAWYYKYSDSTFSLVSKTNHPIASIVKVIDDEIGTTVTRVIGKKTSEQNGQIIYTLEAIDNFVPGTAIPYPSSVSSSGDEDVEAIAIIIDQEILNRKNQAQIIESVIEGVRNGDIIDGAIARSKLESGLLSEIEQTAGSLFPNGLDKESALNSLKARFDGFVGGSGEDFVSATWIIKRSEIASEIASAIASDTTLTESVSQIIQRDSSIKMYVGELREEMLAAVDDSLSIAQSGILMTSQEIQIGVQDLDKKMQTLLTLEADRITALVQDLTSNISSEIAMQADQISAMVSGSGSSAYLSLSVTIPASINEAMHDLMKTAIGVDLVTSVYAKIGTDQWYLKPDATQSQISLVKTALRNKGLLGSQITLDADEILMGGKIAMKHLSSDIVNAGKIIASIIDTDNLVTKKFKIDSDPNSSSDFEAQFDSSVGLCLKKEGFIIFGIDPDGNAQLMSAKLINISVSGASSLKDVVILGDSSFSGNIDSGPLYLSSSKPSSTVYSYPAGNGNANLLFAAFQDIPKTQIEGYYGSTHIIFIEIKTLSATSRQATFWNDNGDSTYIRTGYALQIALTFSFYQASSTKTFLIRDLPSGPGASGLVYKDSNGFLRISP